MFQPNERQQLDLRLFRIWGKATEAIFEQVRRDIRRHGIAMEQFMILELLYNKGPHPIQKISETFSIPSGSITYVVDKLEKQQWVYRRIIPTDRRGFHVILTEKGRELLDDIFPRHADFLARMWSSIGNEEKERLIALLKTVGDGAESLGKEYDSPDGNRQLS